VAEKINKEQKNSNVPPVLGRPAAGGADRFRRQKAKPKNFKGTLKRLWSYFGKEKKLLTIVFIFIFLDSMISLSTPFFIGKAVDAMSAGNTVHFGVLHVMVITLLVAYISSALLNFSQGWMLSGVAQRIVKRLRNHLFEKLQKLPVSFFDLRTHGEMMSRLTNDIDNVSNTISQSMTQLMSGAVVIMGSLIMMIILDPILTLASLITVPFVFFLTRLIANKTKVLFKEQQNELGILNGHIEETVSGFEVVKAFNHEEKVMEEFEGINERLCKVGTKAQIWTGFLMPIMNVINNLSFAILAVVGGYLAVNDMVTIGVVASFITYSRQFVRPLNDLANVFNILQSGIAGAERVFEILDEKEESEDRPDAVPLVDPKGIIEFRNVSFGYRQGAPILQNISFKSEAGSSTALIGPTGAGKTTIINLLTRFYDVTDGQILIDGKDIREYTRDSLRKCFGIVLQDTYLFSGTIMENIKYGNLNATDEEVYRAARMAHADIFINRLPKGYMTQLSENGGNLSHGQRQLLSIARVILTKPAFLILDEATSSIDTRTEMHIQQALSNVMKDRTSFVIAHRLNTIRHADTIMVIQHGKAFERGNHDELMDKKGVYYQMISNQYKSLQAVENV